jgi:hypothetical protein
MSVIINGTDGVTFNDASLQGAAASPYVLKNRLINGAMLIDQRNAGASVANISGLSYSLDRWFLSGTVATKFTVQQVSGNANIAQGYQQSLKVTSSSAYTVGAAERFQVGQRIEGFNISDLAWGTANAKTITLSFWVYSSLTGTFGGSLQNGGATRSYPYTYTISAANTWEQKLITIAGDTSGTWATDNTNGISVAFGLGTGSTYSGTAGAWATADYNNATGATSVVGTSGATFYITGVQLEVGSSATPFERRLYNQELANCQRYYFKIQDTNLGQAIMAYGYNPSTTLMRATVTFPVTLRSAPTLDNFSTASQFQATAVSATAVSAIALNGASPSTATLSLTTTGQTAGYGGGLRGDGVNNVFLSFTAEL